MNEVCSCMFMILVWCVEAGSYECAKVQVVGTGFEFRVVLIVRYSSTCCCVRKFVWSCVDESLSWGILSCRSKLCGGQVLTLLCVIVISLELREQLTGSWKFDASTCMKWLLVWSCVMNKNYGFWLWSFDVVVSWMRGGRVFVWRICAR